MAKPQYERVTYRGAQYLVCVDCRVPLLKGHTTRTLLPEAGEPNPDPAKVRQAMCGPCYARFDMKIYGRTFGKLFDGRIREKESETGFAAPIPKGAVADVEVPLTDYDIFEQARIAARASNGAETVAAAFARLSALEGHVPDTEISGPPAEPVAAGVTIDTVDLSN